MTHSRWRFAPVVLFLLLAGCLELDVRERLLLRADGSGSVTVHLRGARAALERVLQQRRADAARLVGIRLTEARIEPGVADPTELLLQYHFDDVRDIDPASLADERGQETYSFKVGEDGSFEVTRRLALPAGSYYLEIELPNEVRVLEHDADALAGNLLKWYVEFGPGKATERTVHFRAEPHLSWVVFVVWGSAAVALLAFVAFWVRYFRHRPDPA